MVQGLLATVAHKGHIDFSVATYKNSDRTLSNVNYKLCVLDMRVDSRSVDTKMVGERFFLTTFFVLLKVSDGWTLPDYLPTVRNINGNHEQNY